MRNGLYCQWPAFQVWFCTPIVVEQNMAGKFVNPDKENDLFMYLLGKLPAFCGYERSFKMAECTLLTNRFLLGVEKNGIPPQVLLEILDQMNMPETYRFAFQEKLSDANIVLFGQEENEKSCL